MRAVYVEPVQTPLTFDEALERMRQGIHVATGDLPSDRALALALAKTALETGRWKSMWNHNWGNIKAGDAYNGMYTCISLNEVIQGRTVWFAPEGQLDRKEGVVTGLAWAVPPGHPQTRMRAYANGYDGAQEYVSFVANGRYKAAWERLLEGDAVGYVRLLKMHGYFTADEEAYRRGVESLLAEFLPKVELCSRQHQDTLDDIDTRDTDKTPPPEVA